jgi:hypothetical protein
MDGPYFSRNVNLLSIMTVGGGGGGGGGGRQLQETEPPEGFVKGYLPDDMKNQHPNTYDAKGKFRRQRKRDGVNVDECCEDKSRSWKTSGGDTCLDLYRSSQCNSEGPPWITNKEAQETCCACHESGGNLCKEPKITVLGVLFWCSWVVLCFGCCLRQRRKAKEARARRALVAPSVREDTAVMLAAVKPLVILLRASRRNCVLHHHSFLASLLLTFSFSTGRKRIG